MGYYIEAPTNKNKALYLVKQFGAQVISKPGNFDEIPTDKAVIAVVDNGMFEAAGLCYSASELEAFTDPDDPRPITYVLMDKELAYKEAGYAKKY